MQAETQSNVMASKPRHRFLKSISLGMNDLLFSTRRTPWIVFDLFFVLLTFGAGIWYSPYGQVARLDESFLSIVSIYSFSFVTFAIGMGYYDRVRRYRYRDVFRIGTISAGVAVMATLTVLYFLFYGVFGRLTLIWGTGFALVANLILRMLIAFLLRQNPYRFTILGSSPYMDDVISFCSKSDIHGAAYQYVPWSIVTAEKPDDICDQLLGERVGDVVLSQSTLEDPKSIELAVQCLQVKLRVVDEIAFYLQIMERLPIRMISKEWVLREGLARRQVITVAIKRWMDVVLSSIAIVLLAPFLGLIALSIKLTSPGPVIYKQVRQGRYSKPFKMYKFRTMTEESPGEDAGFTMVDDDRVTKVGRVLRRFHLDELPQLWNILRGQMSIVGPRPEALSFADKLRSELPLYDLRYLVRPGLTGHAQLNQGYAMDSVADTEIKLSNDLYYLCYHSFWQDIALILRTVFYILGRGSR